MGGDVVTFELEDGTSVDVARNIVANNAMLHGSLSEATTGDTITLKGLPRWLMSNWLKCVGTQPEQWPLLPLLKV